MPTVCDTTLDFDPLDDGYIYDPELIVIDADGARLTETTPRLSTIETPDVDTSGFTERIRYVEPTAVEHPGYEHRFMLSTDEGATWRYHTAAGWYRGAASRIDEIGNPLNELVKIREWPGNDSGLLRFLILLVRLTEAVTGNISLVSVCYGENVEDFSKADGPLDPLPLEPDFPVTAEFGEKFKSVTTEGGYSLSWRLGSKLRRRYKLKWSGRTLAEKEILSQFLMRGARKSFLWTPPDSSIQRRFRSSEPEITDAFAGRLWNIASDLIETYAGEG